MDPDDVNRLRIAVGRLERRLGAAAGETGLTPSQLAVLSAVIRLGRVGIGELAADQSLNPTMLSRVIGKLDAMGLIRRIPDRNDRRAAMIEPTAAGRRVKERLQQQRTAALAKRVDSLSPGQQQTILAALPAIEALVPPSRNRPH